METIAFALTAFSTLLTIINTTVIVTREVRNRKAAVQEIQNDILDLKSLLEINKHHHLPQPTLPVYSLGAPQFPPPFLPQHNSSRRAVSAGT